MLRLDEVNLAEYEPDFSSSGQSNPIWTKASTEDFLLCNSLEGAEWANNPVQVILCGTCGTPMCSSGGYAHVSRIGEKDVLWTAPQVDSDDPREQEEYGALDEIGLYGSLLIPGREWSRWRGHVSRLPQASALPLVNGRAVADAWRMSVVGPLRTEALEDLPGRLDADVLACDSMEVPDAIAKVRQIVGWLLDRWTTDVVGRIVSAEEIGASAETLYTDGPRDFDWPAFVETDSALLPALGRGWAFVPEESSVPYTRPRDE